MIYLLNMVHGDFPYLCCIPRRYTKLQEETQPQCEVQAELF